MSPNRRFVVATLGVVLILSSTPAEAQDPLDVHVFSLGDATGLAPMETRSETVMFEVSRGDDAILSESVTAEQVYRHDATVVYDWSCKRPGVHRWQAWGVTQGEVREYATGTFRVPRCRRLRYRHVPYGTAARAAAAQVPDAEFVSDINCDGRGRRGARFRTWYCGVRANNSWRECDRFYRITFVRTGGFQPRNTYRVAFYDRECRRLNA